ncbi:multidrug resistance-associated protein 4-like [Pogonomyrmex barbatus]|uniref:Multidrug resistance-associated protein 4-like n=1 Tax=Pogonomyrmex barbatus TaxID=144034 RepID=A0A6I9W2I4_9HYME|nr:multidrug resistance-associated protein 4-like [Pogonomyrmex barbatus]
MDKDTSDMKKSPRESANIFSVLFFWFVKTFVHFYKYVNQHKRLNAFFLSRYWKRELEKLKNLEYTVGKDGQKVPLKKNARPRLYKAIFYAFWLPYFIIGIYSFIQCCAVRVIVPVLQGWIIDYFDNNSNTDYKIERDEALVYVAFLIICNIISVMIMHHALMLSQQIGMRVRISCSSLLYRKLLRINKASMTQTGTGQIMNLLSNDVTRFDQLTMFLNYVWIMPFQIVIIGYVMWDKVGISLFVGVGSLLIISLIVQGSVSLLSRSIRAMIAPLTDRRVQLMSELVAGIQVVKMYAWEKPFSKIVCMTRGLEIKIITFSSYVRATYLAIIVFTERIILYFTLIMFVLTGNNLTADVTYVMATYFNILQLTTALYFPQALIQLGESMVSMNRLEDLLLMNEVNIQETEKTSQSESRRTNGTAEDAENPADRYISKDGSAEIAQASPDLPVCVKIQRVSANWINGQLPPTLCNISLTIQPGTLCALVGPVGSGKSSLLYLLLKELDPGAGTVILTQDSLKNSLQGTLNNGYFTNNPNLRISYASQEPWLFGGTVRDNILFGQPYDKVRYAQVIVKVPSSRCRCYPLFLLSRILISITSSYNFAVLDCNFRSVVCFVTVQYSDIDDSDYEENQPEGEMMARGRLSGKVYKEYLYHGGNYLVLFMLLLLFVISQVATTGNDYWLSYWTSLENVRRNKGTQQVEKEYESIRNDSFLGSIFTLEQDGLLGTVDAIYVYTFCIVACTITTLLRSFLYMKICMNSSRNLHNIMFFNLLQTRMSFFHNNPSGRILNRFSKDIGTMDEFLPKIMLEAIQVGCVVCGIMVMEAIINVWMLIPIVILIILFFFATKFYLKTAQNVKRLEGVTKSPLFSHVNATLNGLPTVRSSGAGIEKMMQRKFDMLQDRHTGTWFLVLTCGTAFGIFMDLIMCLFVACLCFLLVLTNENDSTAGSKAGLAISQSMILIGCLQYGLKQSTETLSLMTSVERILQYTNLPKEEPITSKKPPPPAWPSQGQLVLKNVNMRYNKDDPPVLKNLNLSVEPGWKIGVVGRTGAGKSSLISALFRLFNEGLEGEIKIDDWDTSTVGLSDLRCKISIIPQEPVLFSESLRYNLDPFNQYDDMRLWEVLRQVELNDLALDQDVSYGGYNFSVGQRQLICLARAILRNNRLLVLDEATANIDSHTDALIQDTIRSIFKECTVITIAHRLNTIIDSDRIIVMENGTIVEFGCPYELLHNKPSGYFSQMVEKTGNQMAQSLLEQAKKACERNNDHRELALSTQNTEGESDVTITEQSAL